MYTPKSAYVCLLKDKFKNVHSSTLHNSPDLETTQMPMNNRMEEWINCSIVTQRTNQPCLEATTWMNLINIMMNEKARQTRVHIGWFHLCKV